MTIDRTKLGAGVLVSAGVLLLYHDVLAKLVLAWRTDDNYSHGFFILPIAAYLAWEQRGRLAKATIRPSGFGLVLVLGSVLVLVAGVLGSELFLTRISLLGLLAGIVLFMFGWTHLRILGKSVV